MFHGMTAAEMHVAFELLVQRAASNEYTKLDEDKIDYLLNQAQDAIIEAAAWKRPLMVNDKNLGIVSIHDISSLVSKNVRIPIYTPVKGSEVDDHLYEHISSNINSGGVDDITNMGYGVLPQNFNHYLNSRSVVKYIEEDLCEARTFGIVNNDNEYQEYKAVVPFIADVNEICTNGTIDFRIIFPNAPLVDGTHGPITVFDYQEFSADKGYKLFKNIKKEFDKYVIVEVVLEYLNRFNSIAELINLGDAGSDVNPPVEANNSNGDYFHVYWERYRDEYYPNSFIFVSRDRIDVSLNTTLDSGTNPYSDTAFVTDVDYNNTINPGGMPVQITGTSVVDVDNTGTTPPVVERRFYQRSYSRAVINAVDYSDPLNPATAAADPANDPQEISSKVSINRMLHLSDLYQRTLRKYGRPTTRRPVATLGDGYIFIYNDGTFVINELYLDYIRRPRRISRRAAQNSELPYRLHDKVVRVASLSALEVIASQRYQTRNDLEQRLNN